MNNMVMIEYLLVHINVRANAFIKSIQVALNKNSSVDYSIDHLMLVLFQ